MIGHAKNFAIGTLCAASFMAMLALLVFVSWEVSGALFVGGLLRFILAFAIFVSVCFGLAHAGDKKWGGSQP